MLTGHCQAAVSAEVAREMQNDGSSKKRSRKAHEETKKGTEEQSCKSTAQHHYHSEATDSGDELLRTRIELPRDVNPLSFEELADGIDVVAEPRANERVEKAETNAKTPTT